MRKYILAMLAALLLVGAGVLVGVKVSSTPGCVAVAVGF
jgi:uncharacterized protein YcfL